MTDLFNRFRGLPLASPDPGRILPLRRGPGGPPACRHCRTLRARDGQEIRTVSAVGDQGLLGRVLAELGSGGSTCTRTTSSLRKPTDTTWPSWNWVDQVISYSDSIVSLFRIRSNLPNITLPYIVAHNILNEIEVSSIWFFNILQDYVRDKWPLGQLFKLAPRG
jgi:hypothetical protein